MSILVDRNTIGLPVFDAVGEQLDACKGIDENLKG